MLYKQAINKSIVFLIYKYLYNTKKGDFAYRSKVMREEAYSKTLLLVDDNEINRHILENVFAPDYLSEHAWNGSIGLKKILA